MLTLEWIGKGKVTNHHRVGIKENASTEIFVKICKALERDITGFVEIIKKE